MQSSLIEVMFMHLKCVFLESFLVSVTGWIRYFSTFILLEFHKACMLYFPEFMNKIDIFFFLMFCYCLIRCNCDRFPDIPDRTDRLGCASNACPCDVFTCLSYWRTICCDKRSNSINTSSHSMRSRCRQIYLWLVDPRKGWEHCYTILWQTITHTTEWF